MEAKKKMYRTEMSEEEYEALETARIDPAARAVLKKVLERAEEVGAEREKLKLKDSATREEALTMLEGVVKKIGNEPVEIAMTYGKPEPSEKP